MEVLSEKQIFSLLIIDDNEADRDYYKHCLEHEPEFNYFIQEAGLAKEGIELCKKQKFNCILVDYRLPDKNGLQVLEELKELKLDETAIIMLTGLGDEETAVTALKNGANDYLLKKNVSSISLQQSIIKSYENIKLRLLIKQHELELMKSNSELENFAYIASHDLKEPLRNVINFGNRLNTKYGDQLDGKAKQYINVMMDSSNRMKNLLDSLLRYSRVSSQSLEFQRISLKTILDNVAVDLDQKLKDTNTSVQIFGDPPIIEAEAALMGDLFLNLINNSIKFQKPGNTPQIKINLKEKNGLLKIEFEDNGIGFEDEQAEKIFCQFFRVHGRAEYEGTGIGLSICKKIVEKHNGLITARGIPGKGSVFTIVLPKNQAKS